MEDITRTPTRHVAGIMLIDPPKNCSRMARVLRGGLLGVIPRYGAAGFVKQCTLRPLFLIDDDIERVVKGSFPLRLEAPGERRAAGTDQHKQGNVRS